jgi:hypothetical protein
VLFIPGVSLFPAGIFFLPDHNLFTNFEFILRGAVENLLSLLAIPALQAGHFPNLLLFVKNKKRKAKKRKSSVFTAIDKFDLTCPDQITFLYSRFFQGFIHSPAAQIFL